MALWGFLAQFPPDVIDQIEDEEVLEKIVTGDGLALGDAWDALQWVVTGGRKPGEDPVTGGARIRDFATGGGPATYFVPDEVVEQADALDAITDDHIRSVFDPAAMARAGVAPTSSSLDDLVALAAKVR